MRTRAFSRIAAFLPGWLAQNIKIYVGTLVRAHLDDELRAGVFVLDDMLFNMAPVLAAAIGALILPADGKSVPIVIGLAVVYLIVAAWSPWSAAGSACTKASSHCAEPAAPTS